MYVCLSWRIEPANKRPVNSDGVPRLTKFYTPVAIATQRVLLAQVFLLVSQRAPNSSSFLNPPRLLDDIDDISLVYRRYATLYFVVICDDQELDLAILDLIHVFVECLDKCFANVCELDLVFGWQTLQLVVEEIVQGGMVIDTSVQRIVALLDEANQQRPSVNTGIGAKFLSAVSRDGFWGRL